ncbi:MAG: DUF2177 family protein [Pseudomonadota bacterium]|jgi:uncharacterized membrane protein|uniref:DUF2177 family protein n=1 Tax=Qipengyuania flava TaxID=192812 RepID=A0A3T1CIF8_9SPHN|nr:DUF2177 family protein [Qipengyuania flava]KZX54041.1 hypothetical protein A3711_03705 [Erythrobacter sp. HI00D59]MEC7534489.1 DUF2177 family protein [Pseudomonadota bacterium]MEC7742987.1 DUF2177 family protein [Pseudomonadota bacterium]MEC8836244.1 DUF2177 family protein [Pseudomonadota bacterium]QFI63597.1 DUF2177 family protein [Qipengyuania flava]|tara:strand:+ start:3695 stop:4090 length:396 start_codon:yes stop_codon:yes gene_type:complete
MTWIVAAITAALVFGALDAVWLSWAGPNFYRPRLGDILADSFRMMPALVFYAAYIAAIVWFAVRPGLSLGIGAAALNGALLGAICYATYDLTNQATMRTWSTTVTVADIAWGAFATAVAAAAASFAAAKFA